MSLLEPAPPAEPFSAAGEQASRQDRPDTEGRDDRGAGRRRRYGRQRGLPPSGEWFVSRLGPAGGEPWAAIDDPAPADQLERQPGTTALEDLRFVAVDCETTGQTPHRLVELGAVAFTMRGHVASFETLVHCTDRINPYARRLHGITSAALSGAPRADAVMERFLSFAAGAVLIEHSADAFDTRLLGRTVGRALDADNLDTSRMAGKLWGLRDTIGLERLCAELGVVHRGPHTALGDAEATAACFLELIDRGRAVFGWRTLEDLCADGQPPPPRILPAPARRRPVTTPESAAPAATEAGEDPTRRRRRRGGRRRRRGGVPGETQAPEGSAAENGE